MPDHVRVRFAPSPTGMLHIGGLRTALFNYLFARHHGGKFILRIEDTDQGRYVEGAEADITASLEWAGLEYDEGPEKGSDGSKGSGSESDRDNGSDGGSSNGRGSRSRSESDNGSDGGSGNGSGSQRERGSESDSESDNGSDGSSGNGNDSQIQSRSGNGRDRGGYGPYRQSERTDIYAKYAARLVESGQAYYAFDTAEEINEMRGRLQDPDSPGAKYDAVTRMSMKNSLTLPQDEVEKHLASGEPYIVRLKVPESGSVRFDDLIRGPVSFECRGLDDQVLLKSDGLPTYHLANVVDDHLMEISHVIRGEEWLSSAPKHILLYRYLGWEPPQMAHLPLIMSPEGGKLSKRNAEELGIPVNVRDYISDGYEPEAVVNFLASLGWSTGDDREILTTDEMIAEFSLGRVSKSGAVFDLKKLQWYNEHYFRARPETDLVPVVRAIAEKEGYSGFSDEYLASVIRLMKERVVRLPEVVRLGHYYFKAPETYDNPTVKKAWKENTAELLSEFSEAVSAMNDSEFNGPEIKARLTSIVEKHGTGFGKLMQPVRLAVTGTGFGPELFDTMALLGKEEVVERLNKAVKNLP